jgi:glucose-1-phosphate thymidylyltransferase
MTAARALVLARGLGTRMRSPRHGAVLTDAQRRAAEAGSKAMMPIGERPFLDFILSALADAGIREVGVVVAPAHEELRDHYERAAPPRRVAVSFVVQPEPRGTADAVLAAERWCGTAPFLVVNGDNLYPQDALRALAAQDEQALAAFDRDDLVRSSNIEPARLNAFAAVTVDSAGYLGRIVEKPAAHDAVPGPRLVSMNCWRFDARIFEPCRDVPRSARGEYELPAAVMLAISRGQRFRVIAAPGPVLDLSHRGDAAELTRRLQQHAPEP